MKKWLTFVLIFLAGISAGYLLTINNLSSNIEKLPLTNNLRPLDKYTIDNLANRKAQGSNFKIEKTLTTNSDYVGYLFSFVSEGKKVSGLINLPSICQRKECPLILMIRGYVDPKIYQTGIGTGRAAAYFAKNGFITVAPDFLGYGVSDSEAQDVFEARFQTYTTVLDLISILNSINQFDKNNLFLWAHSNGGQIALTVLEISQKEIPTVLWAPVSKPFPFSILYYTDEADDQGKLLRKKLSDFENLYDINLYSLTNYLERIKAKIQLNQGTKDLSVPKNWNDELSKSLSSLNSVLDYKVYIANDHNFMPNWNQVVENNLKFFKENLK